MLFTSIVLVLWALLLLVLYVQNGGVVESLKGLRSRWIGIAFGVAVVGMLGAAAYRFTSYMTPERERWIVRGYAPGDTASLGFDTKGRFRNLAQPLGRVMDRNGVLLAGYGLHEGHLRRQYPQAGATAHIVGYWTGPLRDGVGVEKALTMVNDSIRDDMPHDARLTLDVRLQRDAMKALGGKFGAIVVMDAATGELLAAANYPTYDPNRVWNDSVWAGLVRDINRRPLTSRAFKDNFSPGSSIKPFIAAAAIHLGSPLPEERGFTCTGSYEPVPRTKPVTDHGSAHGAVDLAAAMRVSCNIYFTRLAYQFVGFDQAKHYLDSIGFDQRLRWNTGMFLNEYSTLLPAVSWVKGRDEIAESRLGIGQASVKTNPIHMAAMLAGIANGGYFPRPVLELERPPDTLRWDIDPAATTRLELLLREPLKPGGTAAGVFNSVERRGITIFGKTGTADLEPDGREPSWFISYGRKNGRAHIVVVAIQNRSGQYAGALNAPMARRMYEALDEYGYFAERSQKAAERSQKAKVKRQN